MNVANINNTEKSYLPVEYDTIIPNPCNYYY